jgi:hypothetical protein
MNIFMHVGPMTLRLGTHTGKTIPSNLSISVIPVLDKAGELSPIKKRIGYTVTDPGRAQTKRCSYLLYVATRSL